MIWRWTPLLAVALLAACARGSRPSLLPVGVHDPRADTPARADIQSPRSHRYRVALAFDATPTYEATGYDTSCEEPANPGTANHEVRVDVKNLDAHRPVPLPDLEIHVGAPRTVDLSRITTLWADPAGCLIDTSDSRRTIPALGSVTIRGSVSRLPLSAPPASVRVFLSQGGLLLDKSDGSPTLDDDGNRRYANEVVALRAP